MTPKEYLQQIRTMDILINRKREEVKNLRSLVDLNAVDYSGDRVQKTSNHDRMADVICKIVDLENEIAGDIEKLLGIKRDVMKTIDEVGEPELIDLLYRRYVRFEKWEKIAYKMNYSLRGIHKLHGKALNSIENKVVH